MERWGFTQRAPSWGRGSTGDTPVSMGAGKEEHMDMSPEDGLKDRVREMNSK